jgi:serine protease Do
MRKLLLSLLLLLPATFHAKGIDALYIHVLNEHVVKMESEEMYCSAFKVEKELFLTAHHCVEHSEGARLFDQFNISYLFEVVKQDEGVDLALLKARIPPKTPIKFASEVKVDEPVLAVGFVYLFYESVVPNSIAAKVVGMSQQGLIAIDHSYRKGFSGGPLVNAKGELVGLNDMTDTAHDVGLAVSVSVINNFLNEDSK